MSGKHKNSKGQDKGKLGVEHLSLSRLGGTSRSVSNESLASATPQTSPLPQTAVAGPSSSAPASAHPKAQSPDANTVRSGLEVFVTSASDLLPPLQPVISGLVDFFELYKDALAADSDYATLQEDLQSLLNTLNTSFSGDDPIIVNLCRSINEELDKISCREEGGTGRRLWEANKDLVKARACRDQIRGHVDTATLKISGDHHKTLTQHEIVLGEHTKRLDELRKSAEDREIFSQDDLTGKELKTLKPSLSARYNSAEATNLRRECTPNTRKEVLSHLDNWRRDPDQGNIFWMNGMAGTGKTTIANTLCATLENEQRLGASFFCTRQLPECRRVKHILPTIAYQLARFSRPFHDALFNALESDPDLLAKNLPTQLEGLILGPLRGASPPLPADVMIVIDALDECEDRAAVAEILEVFMAQASAIPIKVFVSSRPEEEVRGKIGGTESQVVLHELDKRIVKEDIGIYLREELRGASVSDDQLTELVKRAGVLFIYAATVVRFINEADSQEGRQEQLQVVLTAATHENEIDDLYSKVLDSAFSNRKFRRHGKRMRDIVHTVVCAQEPLTAGALAGILKLAGFGLVLDAIRPLWSVLHVSGSGGASLVTTLHASFPDYILDEHRSKAHFCDATSRHGQLAELCLARIQNNARQFNICELESSYVPDEQVPDLEARIENSIPLDLSYTSLYWAVHLELGGWSADRTQPLENFLTERLLMWMEVLNLKKRMNTGANSLEKARKWCIDGGGSEALKDLIHDAWRFVTTFATNPVSHSTPHIYVSMLAFWPSSKLIANYYVKRTRELAEVTGSGMKRRQLALLGVFAVGSPVRSAAFSPDSTRIVCGCRDGTISVWDVQSGKVVLGPLQGHTSSVYSVAFSPDGLRIASGSYDKTIRLWDARSGKMSKPLEGHTREVLSVAFSPDSARLVSGSNDRTIRVWDVQSGQMVLGPLEGHIRLVLSVAFSPDGTRIVAGSEDDKIRVWDSQSGQIVLGPLKAHTDYVRSVAFSPDGNQIVSGSDDRTIRVRDASGKPVLRLKGHTDRVRSVAFSPDSMNIVSGSDDRTVRVWDARSGKLVLGPLEGHTDRVWSVAFSPDGMRLVSSSEDGTLHVWDAQSREVVSAPFEGHTQSVNSVAFSPDGMQIVSGSSDKTVRLWDARSGKMVMGALEVHPFSVSAVAFSLDGTRIVSSSYNTVRVAHLSSFDQIRANMRGYATRFFLWAPRPFKYPGPGKSVAFSPDGLRIVSGSYGSIRVWDVQSGKTVLGPLQGHAKEVNSVSFSPDGMRIVSASDDRTLRMWDPQNGNILLGPLVGHSGGVNSVAFSPNSTNIVSGSDDMTLRVWDVQSGKMALGPLEGHGASIRSVAFSPNGMHIVSGSEDKTVRVWAAQTGELVLCPLSGHTWSVHSVSFSPDSTHIVSGSEDTVIRVWRVPSRLLAAKSEPSPPVTSSSRAVIGSPVPQPSLSRQASNDSPPPWMPNGDGWLVDEHQNLLLWVPPDLSASLVTPINTLLISARGLVQVNFDGAAIGGSWTSCYNPA